MSPKGHSTFVEEGGPRLRWGHYHTRPTLHLTGLGLGSARLTTDLLFFKKFYLINFFSKWGVSKRCVSIQKRMGVSKEEAFIQ